MLVQYSGFTLAHQSLERDFKRKVFCVILSPSVYLSIGHVATAKSLATGAKMPNRPALKTDVLKEWNNRIRREKFDIVLPVAMRKNDIDMWIHVMRIAIPDEFGAEELGSPMTEYDY